MKKIAVGQMHAQTLEIDRNLEKMRQLSQEAEKQGAQLLLLPELCATGYRADERFADLAQRLDGEMVQELIKISRENSGLMLYTSIPEKSGENGKPYNTAVLVNENGLQAFYRKVHLWGSETEFFQAGMTFAAANTVLGKVGLMVCYDVSFAESARWCALEGADILMYVFAFANPERKYAFELLTRTRALENGCYTAASNLVGTEKDIEFFGASSIIDPAGRVLAKLDGEEGVVSAVLDEELLQNVRKAYPYMKDRRADLYSVN